MRSPVTARAEKSDLHCPHAYTLPGISLGALGELGYGSARRYRTSRGNSFRRICEALFALASMRWRVHISYSERPRFRWAYRSAGGYPRLVTGGRAWTAGLGA
jgi:hypothetical protein